MRAKQFKNNNKYISLDLLRKSKDLRIFKVEKLKDSNIKVYCKEIPDSGHIHTFKYDKTGLKK